jgi:large subunit ribosomal protein L9
MKVILQKDIQSLGEAGDIKDVADGFARNFLLPRNLVIKADNSSQKILQHQDKLIKIKKAKRRKLSEQLFESLKNLEVKISANSGDENKLFGSITSMDIAKNLKNMGYEIDRKKIHLDAPIKFLGEFKVQIKLDDGLIPEIKVLVEKA